LTRTKPSKGKSPSDEPRIVNGWQIFWHPLLTAQIEKLVAAVEAGRRKSPSTYKASANFKLLAAVYQLMFEEIPQDPTREKYRQGTTLGNANKHWLRAKFGAGRFRLFFRFSSTAKVIIFVWVNDADSLRTYGARTDAYAVFARMIAKGNPPNEWKTLQDQCRPERPGALTGLARAFGKG
jgi:toxin YhaV